jgi:hypothetical protein
MLNADFRTSNAIELKTAVRETGLWEKLASHHPSGALSSLCTCFVSKLKPST